MTDRILVTGAAGFIGSHLAERLLAEGRRLVCVDNFDPYYPVGIKKENAARIATLPGAEFVEADIRDRSAMVGLLRAERGVDAVIHLAARAGVRPSFLDPALYVDVNVAGTVSLLQACNDAGVPRVVVASSSSVYGQLDGEANEDSSPCLPLSPYGATKLAVEGLCSAYASAGLASVVALRLFSVYGPRQRPDMAINKFTSAIWSGREIEIFDRGNSLRDYTYVDDIVDGIVRALDTPLVGFNVFNLGRGEPVLLSDLVRLLEDCLGSKALIKSLPRQEGDPSQTCAATRKAAALLGYDPQISIRDGVQRYVAWYKDNVSVHAGLP